MNEQTHNGKLSTKRKPTGAVQPKHKESTRVPHRDLIDRTKAVFTCHVTANFQTGKELLAGPVLTNLTAFIGTLARSEEFYEIVRKHISVKDRRRVLGAIEEAYHYGLFLFHVLKPDFADVEAQICRNLKTKLRTIDDPISDKKLQSLCEFVWQCADEKRWAEIENEFYDLTRKRKLDYLELDLVHDLMTLPKKPTSDFRARTHVLLGVLRGWRENERDLLGELDHEAVRGLLRLNEEFYQLIQNKLKRGIASEGRSS